MSADDLDEPYVRGKRCFVHLRGAETSGAGFYCLDQKPASAVDMSVFHPGVSKPLRRSGVKPDPVT